MGMDVDVDVDVDVHMDVVWRPGRGWARMWMGNGHETAY